MSCVKTTNKLENPTLISYVFWVVMPSRMVISYNLYQDTDRLALKILLNIANFLPVDAME